MPFPVMFFQEYEHQTSPEAIFVKDLDQFEMIFQAHEYEQLAKKPGSLQEFFDTTKGRKLSMIVDFVISYNTLLVASRQVLNILKNTIQYIQ